MRNLLSWISVACVSLFAQTLTFVFSGIGFGYALMVLQLYRLKRFEMARDLLGGNGFGSDLLIGINDKDWNGLRRALLDCDFSTAVTQIPVLGWYFVFGFLVGGALSVVVINIATIYHLRRLAQGGRAMAEKLGAFTFDPQAAPGNLKHLPQIVQQLASEFQLPVPQMYILTSEEGMNAFVVGRKRAESVLVVTRGMRLMSQQQLRGIVAHELAHIRNGDMIHNMRLLAVELGINSVRHTAEWMLRTGWKFLFGSSSNHKSAMIGIQWGSFLLIVGLMLWPMGLISSLMGSAVMATTNRRRELRADKLAAKILGSWEPVGDALKRILGHERRGRIAGPDGRKLGHLMFAQANGRSGGMLGTHPKIENRIKKADRRWDGVPLYEDTNESTQVAQEVDESEVKNILSDLPPQTVELFRDAEAVLLTMPALLLFNHEHRCLVADVAEEKLQRPIETLWSYIEDVSEEERFALIELTLQNVTAGKDADLKRMLEQIRDNAPSAAWELQCWVHVFLNAFVAKQKTVKVAYKNFDKSIRPLLEVVSIGASIGSGSSELIFQRVWGHTGLANLSCMCVDAFGFEDLDESMEELRKVPRQLREELANGFAQAMLERNRLGGTEAAFLRYVCLCWG
ncbi:MAG: M48 family metallopeptidase, partial [Rubripirellula sp.]